LLLRETLGFVQGRFASCNTVERRPVNIDAKNSPEPPPEHRRNAGNLRVNEPLGEAYSAYWNWWLEHFARQASYSDRHHMSRDFRKMAQLTPAGLRELLAR
jgi:hypothetical protein